MYCPKCIGKLQNINFHSTNIYQCYICDGLWLTEQQLDLLLSKLSKFKFNVSKMIEVLRAKPVKAHFDNQSGVCPVCEDGRLLGHKIINKVQIDTCEKGHGIWLDTEELYNVILHKLKIKYGIFWIFIFAGLLILAYLAPISRLRSILGLGGMSGGGGASGRF